MTQWHPEAYQYLQQKDYAQAINIYEIAIAHEPEVITYYFYLGLLQLLQGQEAEAQFTWMTCISEDVAIAQIDAWTSELVAILSAEVLRQKADGNFEPAWLVSQHLHEIAQDDIDNSLVLIWLSIQLQNLDDENSILLEVIELLTAYNNSEISIDFNLELLWKALFSLLEYDPYPLLIEFTEACLPFVKEHNAFIYGFIKASIKLAYYQHREDLAISLLEICRRLSPNHLEVLEHLCRIYLKIGGHTQGLETARLYSNLAEKPIDKLFANTLLLKTLLEKGNHWEEALSIFAQQKLLILSLIAENPTIESQSTLNRLYITNYFAPYIEDMPSIYRPLQNQIAQLCQANVRVNLEAQMQKFRQRSRSGSQKLRIGYISRCMATHSVGWLGRWLIVHHDRAQFEIYGYFLAYRQYPDQLQSWYESQMDHVYRAGLDGSEECEAIAKKIDEDGIDILVDLDSTSFDITCGVLAFKPAPIQVSWLGCDASGIPTVDYFIADNHVLPESAQDYYAEKIWRLPQTYIAVDGFEIGVPTLSRDRLDIPADAVVYLSAQTAFKRHPKTVRLQMQIIKSVPNSYFLIKGFGDQDAIQDFFVQIAIAEGVEPHRLRFLPMVDIESLHRANLGIADIVLDTYPYNGATTTLETLWMGIPIVTKVGTQFTSRNSYTMMVNAGIFEGIAWSDQEYVNWGIRLGTDENLRKQVFWKLKESRKTAPLWNAEQFTKDMESAYKQMWETYTQAVKS